MQLINTLRDKSQKERGFIAKLAKETGVKQDRIYKWIGGRGSPSLEDGQKIMAYLGLLPKANTSAPLAQREYEPPTASERIRELEKDKEILRDSINASLVSVNSGLSVIQSSQELALKVLHMILEQSAEIKALVSGQPLAEVMKEVNRKANPGLQYYETGK